MERTSLPRSWRNKTLVQYRKQEEDAAPSESPRSRRRKRTLEHHWKEDDDDVDRLSELPVSLITQILSLLDMKDAVKTSVLSKRWKYCWTQVDSVVFHCDSSNGPIDFHCDYSDYDMRRMLPSVQQLEKYMLFVDHTLMQCTSPTIKKFTLTGSFNYFSANEYYICTREFSFYMDELVDKWIRFLFRKNVQVLKLRLKGLDYLIPECFYRTSSLTSLEIDDVGKHYFDGHHFSSPVELSNSEFGYCYKKTFGLCWDKLKLLSLKSVYVTNEFMAQILSGCPLLKTLVLDQIGALSMLNITSPSVTELRLLNFSSNYVDEDIKLGINAPWVKKLEVSGVFVAFDCDLICVSSLKNANLTLSHKYTGKVDLDHCNSDDDDDSEVIMSNMIDKLLKPVSDVDDLVIGSELLQAVSVFHLNEENHLPFKFKYLTIQSPICIHEVPGIVCLLKSSPNLETLIMRVIPCQCDLCGYDGYRPGHHIRKCFTSFDAVDYLGEQKQNFLSLKNVKIDCREKLDACDEDESSDNECFELEIASYIVKQAPFLEKLVILSSKSNCSECGAEYYSIMSSKGKVGNKAARWELKKTDTTHEFIFLP